MALPSALQLRLATYLDSPGFAALDRCSAALHALVAEAVPQQAAEAFGAFGAEPPAPRCVERTVTTTRTRVVTDSWASVARFAAARHRASGAAAPPPDAAGGGDRRCAAAVRGSGSLQRRVASLLRWQNLGATPPVDLPGAPDAHVLVADAQGTVHVLSGDANPDYHKADAATTAADSVLRRVLRAATGPGRLRVTAVAAGTEHVVLLGACGAAYTFGSCADGRLGHGSAGAAPAAAGEVVEAPRRVEALRGVAVVGCAAGMCHTVVFSDAGEAYTCGSGYRGRLGHGDDLPQAAPRRVEALAGVCAVAAGKMQSAFVDEEGSLFTCGNGVHGILGTGDQAMQALPTRVDVVDGGKRVHVVAVAMNALGRHAAAVGAGGELFTWGEGACGKLGHADGRRATALRPQRVLGKLGGERVAHVSVADEHTAVVTQAGRLYTFGRNDEGRLGDGSSGMAFHSMLVLRLLPAEARGTARES
jgi:hypothetical protein